MNYYLVTGFTIMKNKLFYSILSLFIFKNSYASLDEEENAAAILVSMKEEKYAIEENNSDLFSQEKEIDHPDFEKTKLLFKNHIESYIEALANKKEGDKSVSELRKRAHIGCSTFKNFANYVFFNEFDEESIEKLKNTIGSSNRKHRIIPLTKELLDTFFGNSSFGRQSKDFKKEFTIDPFERMIDIFQYNNASRNKFKSVETRGTGAYELIKQWEIEDEFEFKKIKKSHNKRRVDQRHFPTSPSQKGA